MLNPSQSQSQKRKAEALGSRFVQAGTSHVLFLKSSSDVGVMKNGGRNGARFAPESLLSFFKKLTLDDLTAKLTFSECEVANPEEEKVDLRSAQVKQSERIEVALAAHSGKVCHLGGGHDHVFSLLCALRKHFTKLVVINVDAHADTRTDEDPHSGTPFRQFSREGFPFELYQIGLHEFANAPSTLSPLEKPQHILWRKDLKDPKKVDAFFLGMKNSIDQNTGVFFSLDADALAGDIVPGVSAVNGNGLSFEELLSIWNSYRALGFPHAPMLGIYELNPVYDTLSGISMRTIGAFLNQALK